MRPLRTPLPPPPLCASRTHGWAVPITRVPRHNLPGVFESVLIIMIPERRSFVFCVLSSGGLSDHPSPFFVLPSSCPPLHHPVTPTHPLIFLQTYFQATLILLCNFTVRAHLIRLVLEASSSINWLCYRPSIAL